MLLKYQEIKVQDEDGLLICVCTLFEGHGDAAVSIQRPPQQRGTVQASAGRSAEQGSIDTHAHTKSHKRMQLSHHSCSQCILTLLKSISFSFVPFSLFPPLQAVEATNTNMVEGQLDGVDLVLIQSAFRGHLARCAPEMKRYRPERFET